MFSIRLNLLYFDLKIFILSTSNVMHMIKIKCYIDDSLLEQFKLRCFIQKNSHTT